MNIGSEIVRVSKMGRFHAMDYGQWKEVCGLIPVGRGEPLVIKDCHLEQARKAYKQGKGYLGTAKRICKLYLRSDGKPYNADYIRRRILAQLAQKGLLC